MARSLGITGPQRLVVRVVGRILAPEGHAAVARFDDIVIQDGSSFALKKARSCCSRNGSRTRTCPRCNTANEHIAAGLIWASLCAAVLERLLAHAAQIVGGKPISTRRVWMCAGHIIGRACRRAARLRQLRRGVS